MIRQFRRVGIIALAPYLVLSYSAFPLAADCSDLSSKNHLLIAEAKTSSDTTPAMSGVKLLHQIFLALRGSNQLALNNPTKQLAAATQAFQGSLNPLLAIRPSEKSFNKTAPAIAMAVQDKRLYVNRSIAANESGPSSDIKEYGKKRGTSSLASAQQFNSPMSAPVPMAASAGSPGNVARSASSMSLQTPEIHDARLMAKAKATDSRFEFQPNTYALTTTPRSRIASETNLANNMKMSPQNSKMLTQSMSKLMQSTKQLSELSQANDNSVRSYGQAKRELRDERTVATLPGGPVIQEYSGAPLKVSGAKDLISAETQVRNADSESADAALDAPLMSPDQPGQYRTLRNQLIAMLPPSVVSGIPMARLGATEQELSATLSKKTVSKQKIEDWTVWTVKAYNSRNCAVQLYMRHAVVEAIRVFQPAYLGEEVGIKIGDDLPTIKVKFGEPALILPEPDVPGNHSASKNYVYPISHVAFQLARSKSQPSPQVISVLIFDVQ